VEEEFVGVTQTPPFPSRSPAEERDENCRENIRVKTHTLANENKMKIGD